MASHTYRFFVQLSDGERDLYEDLEIATVLHPSETEESLMARVLAYALNTTPGLAFAKGGVSSGRGPALGVGVEGSERLRLWIDVGAPSPARIEKALRRAAEVRVYATRGPEKLRQDLLARKPRGLDRVLLFGFAGELLDAACSGLARRNHCSLVRSGEELFLQINERDAQGRLDRYVLES